MYEYLATAIQVVDGDTLHVSVDLGFSIHANVTIRLARINAYELTEPRGIVARAYVANLLASIAAMKVQTSKQEKYGRWLAEVWIKQKRTDVDWLNLNDDLVRHSHAVYENYD